MYCKECGAKVSKQNAFCTKCGAKIEKENNNTEQNAIEEIKNQEDEMETLDNSNKKKSSTNPISNSVIKSFIIGILSIILSFFVSVIVIPLSLCGLVMGITTKEKNVIRNIAIILNIISIVTSFTVPFFGNIGIFNHKYDDYEYHIPVSGKWNCKSYDGSIIGDNYVITLDISNNENFSFYNYNDKSNNYMNGTYTYQYIYDEERDIDYIYYSIIFDGKEVVENGLKQDYESLKKYEMGVTNNHQEATLISKTDNTMYYCYKEKED